MSEPVQAPSRLESTNLVWADGKPAWCELQGDWSHRGEPHLQGITLSVYRFQNTIADTILEEGHAMQQRGLPKPLRQETDRESLVPVGIRFSTIISASRDWLPRCAFCARYDSLCNVSDTAVGQTQVFHNYHWADGASGTALLYCCICSSAIALVCWWLSSLQPLPMRI